MTRAATFLPRLLHRLGGWIALPVVLALLLYQPPGVEARSGIAVFAPAAAVITASVKVVAVKPGSAEHRGRALTVLDGDAADLPLHAPLPRILATAAVAPLRRLSAWQGFQARAPPLARSTATT